MLNALSFTELVYGFGILSVAIFVLIAAFTHPPWVSTIFRVGAPAPALGPIRATVDFGRTVVQAAGIVITLLGIINLTSVWRLLWIPNPAFDLNRTVFPDLNGKWEGILVSNGPKHGARERSQTAGGASAQQTEIDCPEFSWLGKKNIACYSVSVSISMTLFETHVRLDQGSSFPHPSSHSKGVSLMRGKSQENHQIMYLFDAEDPIDGKFDGAATLEFTSSNAFMLQGKYWTDRRWIEGKNTAGFVSLTWKS